MRGVPAQLTDIFTSLVAGQRPMMVFLQQGGQLKDMFGGAGPAAKALGVYVAGLVNPFTVGAAAVAALGVAYYQGSQESEAFSTALILSGNAAGTTAAFIPVPNLSNNLGGYASLISVRRIYSDGGGVLLVFGTYGLLMRGELR